MDGRIKQIIKYIDENLDKVIMLEKLAQDYNISYCYLSDLFKKEAGISFSKYLIKKRIKKAKKLLCKKSLMIKQISYSVGYKYISNFNHDFKRLTGLSPSKYKKKTKIFLKFLNLVKIQKSNNLI